MREAEVEEHYFDQRPVLVLGVVAETFDLDFGEGSHHMWQFDHNEKSDERQWGEWARDIEDEDDNIDQIQGYSLHSNKLPDLDEVSDRRGFPFLGGDQGNYQLHSEED